jgi:D-alanine-D-alanine ligase
MSIVIVFGGPSPEHEISVLTGLQCERVLTDAGEEVTSVYWARSGDFHRVPVGLEAKDFVQGTPTSAKPVQLVAGSDGGFHAPGRFKSTRIRTEVVLNACHGGPGELGVLNAILELAGIPCTGGPSYAAQLGMDKLAFGAVVEVLGLPCVQRVALSADTTTVPFDGPFLLKPRFGGSSLGIERVADLETARAFAGSSAQLRAGAVIEPYLDGAADINFSFRTFPDVVVSEPERPTRSDAAILDFDQKYLQGAAGLASAAREFPAALPQDVREGAESSVRRLVSALNYQGIGRVDFLLHEGRILLNEINTIPGAMALYLWPNEDKAELLRGMLLDARRVRTIASAGSTETIEALRVAGGISEKLRPLT